MKYGIAIDSARCMACYACFMACKDEHCGWDTTVSKAQPHMGQFWMNIIEWERGDNERRIKTATVPTPCSHCDNPACMAAAKDGAWVCAICAAPSVLGHLGLLKGHKATCYPSFEQELTGAEVTGAPVEVSGNFITGRGAGAAMAFALKLGEALCGEEKARKVGAAMCVPGL